MTALDPRAVETLGDPGRIIGSRSLYRLQHPDHATVFNAGILLDDGAEIWAGDLDLTLDETRLASLARRLGQRVTVLAEGDRPYAGRPGNLARAVCSFGPDGSATLSASLRRSGSGQLQSR